MGMTADQFMLALKERLSVLVHDERTVLLDYHVGLVQGRGRAHVSLTFINLPYPRVRERRGGGAESENNRVLFFANNFNSPPFGDEPVEKVTVEQLVNNVGDRSENLRKKTASPDKVASYLANYVNNLASSHEPRFTHE